MASWFRGQSTRVKFFSAAAITGAVAKVGHIVYTITSVAKANPDSGPQVQSTTKDGNVTNNTVVYKEGMGLAGSHNPSIKLQDPGFTECTNGVGPNLYIIAPVFPDRDHVEYHFKVTIEKSRLQGTGSEKKEEREENIVEEDSNKV